MAIREIEVFRCWDDHTWDTDFIEVDADKLEGPDAVDDCELNQLVTEVVISILTTAGATDLPAFCGVYNIPENEDEDG